MLLGIFFISCNPYKGFKGVSKKGMKVNKTPSQELRDGYDATSKKKGRKYKKEMKHRKKRLGHSE